jgi:multidrug transporter EmrE-like cation transporter
MGRKFVNSAYLFVATTVLFTVYGQLVIKWQTRKAGEFPSGGAARVSYLTHFLLNPWVISSLLAAVVAAFAWIAALSKLELSRAYPFVSASFVLVLILSAVLFDEPLTAPKLVGAVVIVAGLIIASQG